MTGQANAPLIQDLADQLLKTYTSVGELSIKALSAMQKTEDSMAALKQVSAKVDEHLKQIHTLTETGHAIIYEMQAYRERWVAYDKAARVHNNRHILMGNVYAGTLALKKIISESLHRRATQVEFQRSVTEHLVSEFHLY